MRVKWLTVTGPLLILHPVVILLNLDMLYKPSASFFGLALSDVAGTVLEAVRELIPGEEIGLGGHWNEMMDIFPVMLFCKMSE